MNCAYRLIVVIFALAGSELAYAGFFTTPGGLKHLFEIAITGPDTFDVLIDAPQDFFSCPHLGVVSYGIPLGGPITSVDHNSPNTAFAQDASFVGGPAGFTVNRSRDNELLITASQDTLTPTPHLIEGFGFTASGFADEGLNALAPAEQPVWGAPLLVASGIFDASQGQPFVDIKSIESFLLLFDLERIPQPVLAWPEPASAALVLMALTCLSPLRRFR